jgi:hypothetical protein
MTKFNESRSYLIYDQETVVEETGTAVEVPVPAGSPGVGSGEGVVVYYQATGAGTIDIDIQGQPAPAQMASAGPAPTLWASLAGGATTITGGTLTMDSCAKANRFRVVTTAIVGGPPTRVSVWIVT